MVFERESVFRGLTEYLSVVLARADRMHNRETEFPLGQILAVTLVVAVFRRF
jgi:hypothetical protein